MNSNHPFYPNLIPNTPYVKSSLFFFLEKIFQQGFVERFFLIKAKNKKIFLYWVSQYCCEKLLTIFLFEKNVTGVSATKSWKKSRNFRFGSSDLVLSYNSCLCLGKIYFDDFVLFLLILDLTLGSLVVNVTALGICLCIGV